MPHASRLLIEHQCPQCGAPATLEETDHLFTCTFCRVKSFLSSRDFFRYMLPHPSRDNQEIIYVPYWRIKGIMFSSVGGGVKHKIVDVSCQAVTSPSFPVSLGLRSQVLKLRFVSPETEGRFLKSGVPISQMKNTVEQWSSSHLPKPVFEQALIGESLSQIYSPFYVKARKVYDALLDRPVSLELPEDSDPAGLPGGHPDWRIQFIPALCPKCGWDLEGERDSLVLHCRNCRTLWQEAKNRFTPIRVSHLPGGTEGVLYLPFYQIRAEISGITLESYADLIRVANLPKVVREGWEELPFRFWSPAFKVRPEDFLRFSRNLTLSQPQKELAPEMPPGALYPVTLSVGQASESLKIILASFIKPADTMLPRLQEINLKPKGALLVYIPFQEERTDLANPDFRLRVNKLLLGYAKNL
ncbi:MAG: hypothetical protein JXL84_10140 [Deltaproteobacteria bacterium]|nr:hypothetical protein [Deltaproteobacteria bacterium]